MHAVRNEPQACLAEWLACAEPLFETTSKKALFPTLPAHLFVVAAGHGHGEASVEGTGGRRCVRTRHLLQNMVGHLLARRDIKRAGMGGGENDGRVLVTVMVR